MEIGYKSFLMGPPRRSHSAVATDLRRHEATVTPAS